MKIRVNTDIIAKLNPCKDRFDNWKKHYLEFNGDITKFLHLTNITHSDKLWVALRLIPLDTCVIFALDMSFSAAAYAAAYAASAAADAAADAAAYAADAAANAAAYAADAAAAYDADAAAAYDAAAYDAYDARKKEEKSQIEVLIYLIKGEK